MPSINAKDGLTIELPDSFLPTASLCFYTRVYLYRRTHLKNATKKWRIFQDLQGTLYTVIHTYMWNIVHILKYALEDCI